MPSEKIKSFWTETRAQLDRVPVNAELQELTFSDPMLMDTHVKTRTVHEVVMTSFDNVRIRAWYLVPAGEPPAGNDAPPPWQPGCRRSELPSRHEPG